MRGVLKWATVAMAIVLLGGAAVWWWTRPTAVSTAKGVIEGACRQDRTALYAFDFELMGQNAARRATSLRRASQEQLDAFATALADENGRKLRADVDEGEDGGTCHATVLGGWTSGKAGEVTVRYANGQTAKWALTFYDDRWRIVDVIESP